MQKITTTADLKVAILLLENKQAQEWPLLKQQLLITADSLNLVNIIKYKLKEIISTPDLKKDVAIAAIGLTTGFITKNLLIGKSHNLLTKIMGIVFEMAVANKVAKNADGISSIGNRLKNNISKWFTKSV